MKTPWSLIIIFTIIFVASFLPRPFNKDRISTFTVTAPAIYPTNVTLPQGSFEIAIVLDTQSGKILATKGDYNKLFNAASTIKILTALAGLGGAKEFVIRNGATAVAGTKAGLMLGEKYTRESIYKALLIASGNDAAITLSKNNDSAYLSLMNFIAQSINIHPQIKDSSGLSEETKISVLDLALLARLASMNHDLVTITTTSNTIIQSTANKKINLKNTNSALNFNEGKVIKFSKTGTLNNRKNLVVRIQGNNKDYILALLNAQITSKQTVFDNVKSFININNIVPT